MVLIGRDALSSAGADPIVGPALEA